MTARHSTLIVTQDEIQAIHNDEKVLSIRPSGVVGVSPVAAGNFGALSHMAGSVTPSYSITTLGNLAFLSVGGFITQAMAASTGTWVPQSATGLPAAYCPKTRQVGTTAISVYDPVEDTTSVRACAVFLGTDGTLALLQSVTGTFVGFTNVAATPLVLTLLPFSFSYVLN